MVASVLPRNSRNSQKFGGAVGCVGMAGCHTLLICAHPCASVRICGRLFSARNFCAFRGNIVSHGFHRSTQMVGCVCSPTEFTEFTEVWGAVGCVGTAECHTLLHLCKSVLSVGATSQPEGSVRIRANLWEVLLSQKVLCFPCVLWEVLLCQKVLCVPCILWDLSLLVLLVQFLL